MNAGDQPTWLAALRRDKELLQEPLLVRLSDPNSARLDPFLDDLIAWNAGLRDYASAAQDYQEARSFPLAARCIEQLDMTKPANAKLADDLKLAWDTWRSDIQRALGKGRQVLPNLHAADCDPQVRDDLDEAIGSMDQHLKALGAAADTANGHWLTQLAKLDEAEWSALQSGADSDFELLQLATDQAEEHLTTQTERKERALEAVRSQAAQLIGTMLMNVADVGSDIIERALSLRGEILDCIGRNELSQAQLRLGELAQLGGRTTPEQASLQQAHENPRYTLSPLVEPELREASDGPIPKEYPAVLDNPPALDWHGETLEENLLTAQRLAATPDHPFADRALGPFLTIRAKQLLLGDNPEHALIFFRDAYRWAATPPRTLRAALRWRQDCAWGLLLCVAVSAMDGPERRKVLSQRNLAALFQRPIGDQPLAHLSQRKLLPDLANALMSLLPTALKIFFKEHLFGYLTKQPVALQDLARGFADDFLEQPWRVLEVYALMLRIFGGPEPTAEELSRLAASLDRESVDRNKLRNAQDAAQRALDEPARQSDLAEAMRLGLGSRTGDLPSPTTPRVSVALIPDEEGHSASHRLVLGISYTKGDEILRGVRLEASLRDQDDRLLDGCLESPARIGRLAPLERVEIALAYQATAHLGVAKTIKTRVLRRLDHGAVGEVESLGRQLTLVAPKPSTGAAPPDNPYVVGRALQYSQNFYGRNEQIDAIVRGLIGQHQDNVVLVLGERRIGKTTVLFHLKEHERIKRRYIVTYRDMESAGDFNDTATFYREYLIRPIREELKKAGLDNAPQFSQAALSASAHTTFERFMAEVDELLAATDHRLLVILDEIEKVLEEDERPRRIGDVQLPEEVLASIRSVLLASRRISFVLAGVTDVVRRHIHDRASRLFNLAVDVELKHLAPKSAKELICKPAAGVYSVTASAQDMVIEETNCHPYLIQQVGRALFEYMVKAGNLVATTADVRAVLEQNILPNAQPFSYLLETLRRNSTYLPIIDTLAFLQSGRHYVYVDELVKWLEGKGLKDYGEEQVLLDLEALMQQVPSLLRRAPNNKRRYQIAIGLFAGHRRLLQQTENSLVVSAE